MRRAIAATCLVLALGASAAAEETAADDVEARFDEAVAAYRGGDYETATTLWRRLFAEAGPGGAVDPAVLCYDLGNAAFRLDRPLEAAAWYTAAVRLAPRDTDAWSNLERARDRARLEPADRGDLLATLRRLVSVLTLAEAEWVVLSLALALALTMVVAALQGGVVARRATAGLALALAVACVPWLWRLATAERDPVFVVASGGASVQSEPRASATAVGRVEPGAQVERIDGVPGWVRVQVSAGLSGWVPAVDVLPLKPPVPAD